MEDNDFKFIFWIEFMGLNDSVRLSDKMGISEEDAEKKLVELKKQGFIEIENREGKIYGSRLTEKGKEIFNDDKYKNLKMELGY